MREEAELLFRADSAGLCHKLLEHLHGQDVRFSVGMDMTEDVRQAVLQIADDGWGAAITKDGKQRENAFVSELSLDLPGWPEGARAVCRRERAHPGAQLSLIDTDGFRHQVLMTDQPSNDIAQLDLTHRGHARVKDRIRCSKQTGLENLPFREFALNEVWLEARSRRTEAAALPAASPSRADRPLRTQNKAAARVHLAVGTGARDSLRAHPGSTELPSALTRQPANAEPHRRHNRPPGAATPYVEQANTPPTRRARRPFPDAPQSRQPAHTNIPSAPANLPTPARLNE